MALQAGMGLSRIVFIVGAGYTGTILMQNGKLSDILGGLQNMVKGMEKGDKSDGDTDHTEAIAAQVRRLAAEIRHMASNRQITVLNGSSGSSNLTSLIVPAAVCGAAGYGYMWWKGLSFSDLMYVTKQNMATAVTNLTKHLDSVSDALAKTKRHLTQRLENLDGKLDDQVEISKLIRNDVNEVRGDLSQIGFDLDDLQRMVSGLDGKLLSLESKQDDTNKGVMYLCHVVNNGLLNNGAKVKLPEILQDQMKNAGSLPSLMGGLKDLDSLASLSSGTKLLTDGHSQNGPVKLNRPILRMSSNKL